MKAEAEARKLKEAKEVEKTEVENIEPDQEDAAEVEQETTRQWLNFKAYLSIAEAKKLGDFCKENNICIKPLSTKEMRTLINIQEAK